MTVRAATVDDLSKLIELGLDMHQESAWQSVSFSRAKTLHTFSEGVANRNGMHLTVYELKGTVEGFFLGAIVAPLFSEELIAFDLLLYITPKCRGGLGAYHLWRAFRDKAKSLGVVELRFGISTGVNIDRSHRFYIRLGMDMVGSNYRLSLKN